jgi:preprotein translocase SecE subunit
MATAVHPTTAQPQPLPARAGGSILVGSLISAAIILAGVVAAGYVSTQLVPTTLPYIEVFRLTAFLAVAAAGVFVAGRVAAMNPAPGLSGGIILAVSGLIATAFLVRAFEVNLTGTSFGPYVTAAVAAVCLFGVYWLLTSKAGTGWATALDHQGWTDFHSHKRSQGLQVRRYAMIGVLLVGLSGAWSVFSHQLAGTGTAEWAVPFTAVKLPLLPSSELVVPLLITLATLWAAWRMVNVPPFADFLIATEAEMNKVSWTSRKRLIQDTIVVLVTVVVLTLFLLVIDLFWGWLLSQKYIEILPSRDSKQQQTTPDGGMKLSW